MSDTIQCPHCGTQMEVAYDRFYGGIPRYRAQCRYCGMAGPLCAAEAAAISAVSDLGRDAQSEIERLRAALQSMPETRLLFRAEEEMQAWQDWRRSVFDSAGNVRRAASRAQP